MSKIYNNLSVPSVLLRKPRITEKAASIAEREKGVYTFEVSSRANKTTIKSAVKELFKVTPTRVNIINTSKKVVYRKGKRGVVSGVKKAMVYLKKGDKIDFV